MSAAIILFCLSGNADELGTDHNAMGHNRIAEQIIAPERSALDRWIALDPEGYLALYSPRITYFDPTTDRRVDGRKAMEEAFAPMKTASVPFTERRYEMIGETVQLHGDVAVLTFNLFNYGRQPGEAERVLAR